MKPTENTAVDGGSLFLCLMFGIMGYGAARLNPCYNFNGCAEVRYVSPADIFLLSAYFAVFFALMEVKLPMFRGISKGFMMVAGSSFVGVVLHWWLGYSWIIYVPSFIVVAIFWVPFICNVLSEVKQWCRGYGGGGLRL